MKRIILSCAIVSLGALSALAQNKQGRKPVTGSADNVAKTTTSVSAEPQTPVSRPAETTTPEQRMADFAKNRAMAFKRQYNLNEKQYQSMYDLSLDLTHKIESYTQQGKQISNAEYEQLMNEHDGKLKGILSATQYAQYESTRIKPAGSK